MLMVQVLFDPRLRSSNNLRFTTYVDGCILDSYSLANAARIWHVDGFSIHVRLQLLSATQDVTNQFFIRVLIAVHYLNSTNKLRSMPAYLVLFNRPSIVIRKSKLFPEFYCISIIMISAHLVMFKNVGVF